MQRQPLLPWHHEPATKANSQKSQDDPEEFGQGRLPERTIGPALSLVTIEDETETRLAVTTGATGVRRKVTGSSPTALYRAEGNTAPMAKAPEMASAWRSRDKACSYLREPGPTLRGRADRLDRGPSHVLSLQHAISSPMGKMHIFLRLTAPLEQPFGGVAGDVVRLEAGGSRMR